VSVAVYFLHICWCKTATEHSYPCAEYLVCGLSLHLSGRQPCGAPIKFAQTVHLSVHMKQLENHYTDFHKIWYWGILTVNNHHRFPVMFLLSSISVDNHEYIAIPFLQFEVLIYTEIRYREIYCLHLQGQNVRHARSQAKNQQDAGGKQSLWSVLSSGVKSCVVQ
jgi:hypothetical protein